MLNAKIDDPDRSISPRVNNYPINSIVLLKHDFNALVPGGGNNVADRQLGLIAARGARYSAAPAGG